MTASMIAIDGPAGAGKSTVAKEVARRLGYLYIDTGAMYRSIAYLALQEQVPFTNEAALSRLAREARLELKNTPAGYQVRCNGADISAAIRTPEVGAAASPVSAVLGVREALTAQQRTLAQAGQVVLDGRDIGTKVLPDADLKIFLTASLAERARRRTADFAAKGIESAPEQVAADIAARDQRDSGRAHAPLKQAEDAVYLDSSELSAQQVIEKILALARSR